MHFRFLPIPIFGRIEVYFSCKGKLISNQEIQLYVYNNISYKTVSIRNFRLMGNNVNFGKWKWDHFVIGSGRRPWLLCFMFTKILPRMHLGLEMGTKSSILRTRPVRHIMFVLIFCDFCGFICRSYNIK